MASVEVMAERMLKAHERTLEVLREHGSPENNESLDRITNNAIKPSFKSPYMIHTLHAEQLAGLAGIVGELIEANKPRPRGRPPKNPNLKER